MNNDYNISFVMPAFNCEDTIDESVNSIMKSNFQQGDELIIVNDGSYDKTGLKIDRLSKKYKNIQIVRNGENLGCPASRNIGISLANNPLIFNLDADDILEKNSVEKLKTYILDNNADIAAFSENWFFKQNIRNITHKWINPSGIYSLSDFLAGPITPGGNCLYTKKSWKKVGKYWEYGKGLHEYWGFFLKQLANGSKMVILENSHYFHRIGKKSLFARENVSKEISNKMASKMISPFLDLVNDSDADYLKSKSGKISWLSNLKTHPIKIKNKPIGKTGYIIALENKSIPSKLGTYFRNKRVNIYRIPDEYVNVAHYYREKWIQNKAKKLKKGTKILDVGAGKCKYREIFKHCIYKTQDFSQYKGTDSGPLKDNWQYGQIDFVSDITKIPVNDKSFDVIMCTEVLEHVPEPIKAIKEFSRILNHGGKLWLTAPLSSGLHMEPYHYYGGFTPHFYKHFLNKYGFKIINISPTGGLLKHVAQELHRSAFLIKESLSFPIRILLQKIIPKYLAEIDDKYIYHQFTIGYLVEAEKL